MSMKANRVTANNLELPADRELALYASGDEQKHRIKQIRANAIQEAKSSVGTMLPSGRSVPSTP